MDTDRQRLGKSGVEKVEKGDNGGEESKKRMPLLFTSIHLHPESECNHFATLRRHFDQFVQQEAPKWDLMLWEPLGICV